MLLLQILVNILRVGYDKLLLLILWIKDFGLLRLIAYFSVFQFMIPAVSQMLQTGNVFALVYTVGSKIITAEHNIIAYTDNYIVSVSVVDKSTYFLYILSSYVLFVYLIKFLTWLQGWLQGNPYYSGSPTLFISLLILLLLEWGMLVTIVGATDQSTNVFENQDTIPGRGLIYPFIYLYKYLYNIVQDMPLLAQNVTIMPHMNETQDISFWVGLCGILPFC